MSDPSFLLSSVAVHGFRRSAPGTRGGLAGPVLALAALVALLASPARAQTFHQDTQLEGRIGSDIGGIWLIVHDLMPEFRVRYRRNSERKAPKSGSGQAAQDTPDGENENGAAQEPKKDDWESALPFKLGPVPAELDMGSAAPGLIITEITDVRKAADYSIIKGDIVVKVDSTDVRDLESFEDALHEAENSDWIGLQLRRTALKYSTPRLVKIRYVAAEAVADAGGEISTVGKETVSFEILEVAFPFDGEVAKARTGRKFWKPSSEQIEALRESWFKLPKANPVLFAGGEHRVIGEDALTPDIADDPNFAGARFAVVSTLLGNPMRGGGKNIVVYGAREVSRDRISGGYIEAAMGNAPFPITVEFKGRFTMTRLDEFSHKDFAYRNSLNGPKVEEDYDKIELAPDIPEDL